MSKNKFEIHGDRISISHLDWDFIASASIKDDYAEELQSVTWSIPGVRPHKEKINISEEIINKTRGAVAPCAAQIFTHLSVVSSRQRSKNQGFDDRLRCEKIRK